MTVEEFSNEFDVLFNNITSDAAPGFNEYEKSVFLTKAQDQLVNEFFNIRVDQVGAGFDGSQRRQYDFSRLIKTATLRNISNILPEENLDRRSLVYEFPDDYFLSVNEILFDGNRQYSVAAISYEEYRRLMMKPFAFPVKRSAWRIFTQNFFNSLYLQSHRGGIVVDPEEEDLSRGFKLFETNGKYALCVADDPTASTIQSWVGITVSTDGTEVDVLYLTTSASEVLQRALSLYSNYKDEISDEQAKIAADYVASMYKHVDTEELDDSGEVNINVQCPKAEVIGRFESTPEYHLRYVKTLPPIILTDLDTLDSVSIKGKIKKSECILPPDAHQEVLERAVFLAKAAWAGTTGTQVAQEQEQNNRGRGQ